MFDTIGSLSSRRSLALIVVLAWVLAGSIIAITAPPLAEVTSTNQEDFLPANVESVEALNLVQSEYPRGSGTPAILVFNRSNGLLEDDHKYVASTVSALRQSDRPELIDSVLAPGESPQLDATLKAPDGKTVTAIVNLRGSPASPEFAESVDWIRATTSASLEGTGLNHSLTGPAGIISDAVKVFESIDFRVTLFTVLLVLVLLLVIYRSPLLALLPIICVGFTLYIAQCLTATLATNAGLKLTGQVTALMSVLVFGAGTDYTLFLIARYREQLLISTNKWEAMKASVGSVGPSIASSAGTTIAAMLALLLASLGSFQALGPALAIGIGMALAAGLTLIPAVTVLLGKAAFWPIKTSSESVESKTWNAVARYVVGKPAFTLVATSIVLTAGVLGAFTFKPSYSFLDGFPEGTESRVGQEILNDSFGAGTLAPTNVYLKLDDSVYHRLEEVDNISSRIDSLPGVAQVTGPTRPDGKPPAIPVGSIQDEVLQLHMAEKQSTGTLPQIEASRGTNSFGPAQILYTAGKRFVSPSAQTARLDVVLTNDPYSENALDTISDIRSAVAELGIDQQDGRQVLVGGPTAIQADTRDAVAADVIKVGPIVAVLIWIILLLLLRSVVAASYLLFSVLFSFLSAFGVSVIIFQYVLGHPGVGYQNGVWMFIFLAALGADYNILMMSRIKEEAKNHGLQKGTQLAVSRTGGIITSAGIILAGTFSILMTLPLREVFQLGFAVSFGVLMDTFIVRALFVPSIVLLLKNANWWPSRFTGPQNST